MKHLIYILSAFALLSACSDDVDRFSQVSEEQKSLLGRAINFDASVADAFTSRATYNGDGSFNEGDVMTIYRQYSDDGANFDETHENYRVYYYKPTYAGSTGIILKTEWAIMTGQYGSDGTADDVPADRKHFLQQESDTLTWEDGRTVKFRAWALSNLSGAYGNKASFYPDFTISDWVHASGPTSSIPLTLRHIGFRMGFTPYPGNQITSVEICLNKEDYQRKDNADSATDDESDKLSDAEAEAIANKVKEVYNRMCMPGGVDIEKQQLRAMSNDFWNSGNFRQIVSEASQKKMIDFATKTRAEIAADAKRPVFIGNNGNFYCISIPHDMSNDANTSGEVLTLPLQTRFRVYLRDVNSGDGMNTSGEEGTYHIFSLSDVLTDQAYSDGLKLYAGYSCMFQVGYLYNEFKVDPVHSFSWVEQDLGQGSFADDIPSITPSKTPYKWWQEAIDDAITTAIGGGNFNPNFTISSEAQFLEFINLVNGTAATNAGSLARVWRNEPNSENRTNYWWYDPTNVYTAEPPVDDNGDGYLDTLWVTQADAAATRGFIFYKHYYPADGDRAAYYTVDYLQGAYNFYSNIVGRAFTVTLTADLDFKDIQLPAPVGNSSTNYFGGIFNGGMHTISNVNLTDGYLFEYTSGASVTNFTLMGKHRLAVVKQGKNTNIAGIASYVPAPATGHALADELISTSYVVGCIHYTESVYDTPGALVGDADNLYMYGCMQTSRGIEGGALVGRYYSNLAPQDPNDLKWGRFMCNYYDTTLSPSAHAVGNINDNYAPQEYIRGRRTHILCAYNDHLVDKGVYEQLNDQQKLEFYGLAPWKAMNYGIHQYNTTSVGKAAPCNAHYSGIIDGYSHLYPLLSPGVPTTDQYADVLKQGN